MIVLLDMIIDHMSFDCTIFILMKMINHRPANGPWIFYFIYIKLNTIFNHGMAGLDSNHYSPTTPSPTTQLAEIIRQFYFLFLIKKREKIY